MKVIRAHLKDRSGEFRRVSVAAADEAEAVAIIEALEAKRTRYQLSPEEALRLEKKLKSEGLAGKERAQLFTHQQGRPYKLVKIGI